MILPFWPSIVTAPDGVSVDCVYESPVKKYKQSAATENRVALKSVRVGCRLFPIFAIASPVRAACAGRSFEYSSRFWAMKAVRGPS